MSNGEWVVAFDTDRIKDYLFATNKLKEIRGASELLDNLNLQQTESAAKEACPAAEKVYTGGGGALFIVPSEAEAKRVCAAVEKLYRRETVLASITGAFLPLSPATRQHGFGQRARDLMWLVRRNKAQKAEMPGMPVAPYLSLCDACGRHPAARRRRSEEGQELLLCRACDIKRESALHLKTDELEGLDPGDFDELGELSKPPGYLGFIYADGNLMGEQLAHLETKQHYADFARDAKALLGDARETATNAFGLRRGMKPYIELLWGGDDLLLVTAADLALPVALHLAQIFEARSPRLLEQVGRGGRWPTLSVGVVLAHADYPIAEMYRLSQERLRSAKQCSFKTGYDTGAVDFEVVTSAVGYEADRKLAQGEWAYRNRRPYTLAELAGLLDQANRLQDFPTSQLQAMYESLSVSKEAATLTCLLALVRARPRRRQLALRNFFVRSGSLAIDRLPPWCEPDKTPVTDLGDLVEILPFVPERR